MKLYYSKGACSLSVRILIHELNLTSEYEEVNLSTKKTISGQDFWKINPKGEVPVLVLDNGEILTENMAIHQFLADQEQASTIFPTDFKRYRVIEWLSFVSTDLHKGFGPLFNPEVPEELKENLFKKIMQKKLAIVDQHLMESPYLVGDDYTLADGYMFVVLRWAIYFKLDFAKLPNIIRYFKTMKERKSVEQSLEEEGLKAVL